MAISSNATGLRPGVCTSTTRPTAPYTGQLIYETDTGYLRVWDGSAWDYLAQKQDTTQGLPTGDKMGFELVKTVSVGSTAVSSVDVTSCFSSSFTNYRVVIDQVGGLSSGANLGLRLLSGTSPATSAYYGILMYASVTVGSTYVGATDNNASAFSFISAVGNGNYCSATFDILNPYDARETRLGPTNFVKTVGATDIGYYQGTLYNTTSYDGFRILPNTGTVANGTIYVYGYRK